MSEPASLWRRPATPDAINARMPGTTPGLLGIRITAVTEAGLEAEMPVDERHIQPAGILHGGVSVVLSETLGSLAATCASPPGQMVVGLEVNANHLAVVPKGQVVTATCRPLHVGRSTQVWQTEIRRADGKLACVSRLTAAVMDPPSKG
ncbi:hotdog fold thioesterase [Roseomonas hellenica]|uniref:Hotdog fold thioesterase n=1 Tax=Plastoroseomonas hellenica TaxID=2687306 RepID=A0ABS5F129_9PROT|nr:hotdog fold thioesterase [Plastoroseomonas hellenica]MBR0666235.1 hotdog fold thioesterase [Plastoroseomonas hellenica]